MIDNRLVTLLDVAQTLNYTQTANNLNITQSTVSKHIKFLENHYQTKLVEYSSQKLYLTPTAIKILPYIEKIYFLNQNLLSVIHSNNWSKSFNIGISFTLTDLIGDILLQFLEQTFPKTKFNLIVNNTSYLNQLLINQEIDFMLISGPLPTNIQNYKHGSFMKLFLTAFSRSDVTLPTTLSLTDLYELPVYARETGSGLSDTLDLFLSSHGIKLENFKYLNTLGNNQMIKRKVLNSDGIGILYSASINKEIKKGILNPIFILEFNQPSDCYYVYKEDTQTIQTNIQKEIIKFLKQLKLD